MRKKIIPLVTLAVSLILSNQVRAEDNVVRIDGSSTVYPLSEAVGEEFGNENKGVKITVGVSGTGGGFKKFCAGETDVSNASRPIKAVEVELCKTNAIEFIELPISYDALSVVVNPKNDWVKSFTVAELKKIWEPEAQKKIKLWSDVRPEWPAKPISLFGAGVDSGTYDYFTDAIVGKEHSSRGDFFSSEDDNILVQGVANDQNALGFFGLAYYLENSAKLKAVGIDDGNETNGAGPQMPSAEGVIKGTYQPLSRPLFIYVSVKSLQRDNVKKFVQYYLNNSEALSKDVGMVPLASDVIELVKARFAKGTTGSILAGKGSQVGVVLKDLLK